MTATADVTKAQLHEHVAGGGRCHWPAAALDQSEFMRQPLVAFGARVPAQAPRTGQGDQNTRWTRRMIGCVASRTAARVKSTSTCSPSRMLISGVRWYQCAASTRRLRPPRPGS